MSLETSSQSQSFKLDNLLQSHLSHELQGTITGLVNSIMIRLDFDDKDKEAKSIKTAKDKGASIKLQRDSANIPGDFEISIAGEDSPSRPSTIMAGAWNFDEWIDDMKQLAPGYYVKAGDVYAVKTQNSFVFTTNNSSITFEPSDQNYPLHLYTPVVRQRLLAENPEGAAFATFESLVEVLQRAGNAGRGEEIRCLNEGIMSGQPFHIKTREKKDGRGRDAKVTHWLVELLGWMARVVTVRFESVDADGWQTFAALLQLRDELRDLKIDRSTAGNIRLDKVTVQMNTGRYTERTVDFHGEFLGPRA